jgi:tetratricopeptide (TPR) repeat protein
MRTLLLLVASVCLSTWLEPWSHQWEGNRRKSGDVITVALGDSRKLFARHFFVKADAYFHNGYYPSIYDKVDTDLHMTAGAGGTAASHKEETDYLGKPKDWMDKFSRSFFPSVHTHLGEEECEHCKHGDAHEHEAEEKGKSEGLEREMLPWFKLAASLDPEQPQTYVVAAFWLSTKLGKVDEAEYFLREGLRANPGNFVILYELGRIAYEHRKQTSRARNLWAPALENFRKADPAVQDAELLMHCQILSSLAKLEQEQKNNAEAIRYFTELKKYSPFKEQVQAWIDYLK